MDKELAIKISRQQQAILQALGNNEETIARLYRALAKKFPGYKDVWAKLAAEEEEHARIFDEMAGQLVKDNIVLCGLEGLGRKDTAKITSLIENHLTRVIQGQMNLPTAIAAALSIEQSLIESPLFKQLWAPSDDLDNKLQRIKLETTSHRQTLESMLDTLHNT